MIFNKLHTKRNKKIKKKGNHIELNKIFYNFAASYY